jgi:hypothetical protein
VFQRAKKNEDLVLVTVCRVSQHGDGSDQSARLLPRWRRPPKAMACWCSVSRRPDGRRPRHSLGEGYSRPRQRWLGWVGLSRPKRDVRWPFTTGRNESS